MARTNPLDTAKHRAMLQRRLQPRENPFPEGRWPSLDDLVFLPANLSRLVIDPYREACRTDVTLGAELRLDPPFLLTGFDAAPQEIQRAIGLTQKESDIVLIQSMARHLGFSGVGWMKRQIIERLATYKIGTTA